MLELLSRWLITDYQQVENRRVRKSYGYLGGAVGILVNGILFFVKLILGFWSGSVAITADAFNNLSDASSSVAMILGFYYSNKPADKEHPFGHGRVEYVMALFISCMVILVGIRFMKTSVERIVSPREVNFSKEMSLILVLSILLKGYLAVFNRKLGLKIKSDAIVATAFDSISDVIITTVVLLGLLLSQRLSVPIDGYIGGVVSLFIFIGGIKLVWETLTPILGEAADETFMKKLEESIRQISPVILGTHDMLIHDYGPGRMFVMVDVEMPDSLSLTESHRIADEVERKISQEFGLLLFVHVDPKNVDNLEADGIFDLLKDIVNKVDGRLKFHDFQVDFKEGTKTVLFDLIVPYDYTEERVDEIKTSIEGELKRKVSCRTGIRIDREGVHVD